MRGTLCYNQPIPAKNSSSKRMNIPNISTICKQAIPFTPSLSLRDGFSSRYSFRPSPNLLSLMIYTHCVKQTPLRTPQWPRGRSRVCLRITKKMSGTNVLAEPHPTDFRAYRLPCWMHIITSEVWSANRSFSRRANSLLWAIALRIGSSSLSFAEKISASPKIGWNTFQLSLLQIILM